MTHELPALVQRYFDYALPDQWPVINEARQRVWVLDASYDFN